jgi:hypothetical protein
MRWSWTKKASTTNSYGRSQCALFDAQTFFVCGTIHGNDVRTTLSLAFWSNFNRGLVAREIARSGASRRSFGGLSMTAQPKLIASTRELTAVAMDIAAVQLVAGA